MDPWLEGAERDLAILARLAVTLVLAGALGWEREKKHRPAGLRTHMLVGMSATLFVSLGDYFVDYFEIDVEGMRYDPLRIIEATVAGVSFLGAGTIFVSRDNRVRGLTTAASLLATAGVGMAVGLERWVLAVGTTLILLAVLTILRRVAENYGSAESDADPE